MLPFKRLELSDLPGLRSCYAADNDLLCRICDATPGTAAMWRRVFDVRFYCEANTVLYAVRTPDGREAFSFPIGAQPELMLQRVKAHCASSGQIPVFYLVSPSKLDMLRRCFGEIALDTNSDDSDYLYARDALVALVGRKYSAQRNHIHKFEFTVPDWRFEVLGPDNLALARSFFSNYKQTVHKDSALFDEE